MKLKNTILAVSLLGAITANGAVIAWSSGTSITGASDVLTAGAFVLGHNYGSTGTTAGDLGGDAGSFTVNGVVFTQTAIDLTTTPPSFGPQTNAAIYGGAADANLHGILDSNMWGGGVVTPAQTAVIRLSGLTANTSYTIQVFAGDERPGGRIATVANSDGTGSQSGAAGDSTSFLGTFTTGAAETTVEFQSFSSSGADGDISISAVQLRETVMVPEPSSTALLGLGALALILRRRN